MSAQRPSTRWWIVATAFLCLNAVVAFRIITLLERRLPPAAPTVAWSLPDGALISNTMELAWTFSAPMAPADVIGVWRADGPVLFSPRVAGRFCWSDSHTLRFQPAAPWPLCTAFIATFDPQFATAHRLPAAAMQRRFHTQPLSLTRGTIVGCDEDRCVTVRFVFNAPPDLQRLPEFIEITVDGKPVQFSVEGATAARAVHIKTAPIRVDEFNITVRQGLPPATGSLPIAETHSYGAWVPNLFALDSIAGSCFSFSQPYIVAKFTAPVKLPDAQAFISINPPVPFSVSHEYSWKTSSCQLDGPFLPGARYDVTLHAGLPAANGATLSSTVTRTVYIPDRQTALEFNTRGFYLSPRGSLLVPLTLVNLSSFDVQAERIFPNNLVQFAMRRARRYSGWYGDDQEGISQLTAPRTYTASFPPNVVTQMFLNMRDLMGPHTAGAYWLSATTKDGDTSEQLVIISDIGVSFKQSPFDIMLWANSLRDATAISGAHARIYSEQNQLIAEGTTDANGLWLCQGDFAATGRAPFLVTVTAGDDMTYLALDSSRVRYAGGTSGRAFITRGYESYVYTDRGIYRPGETAHIALIVRDAALAAPPPFPLQLHIMRPDGRLWRTLPLMLNQRGTATADVELPRYLRTGRYGFEARIPGADTAMGAASIALEEFVPPQIVVRIIADAARTNTSSEFIVRAEHLFGAPAAGLRAQASTILRPVDFSHPNWPDFIFADHEKKFSAIEESAGRHTLDTHGIARFTAEVATGLQPPSALKLIMSATVIEPGGRAVSAVAMRPLDVYPVYVGIKPAVTGSIVPAGKQQSVAIAAVRPDGRVASQISHLRAVLFAASYSTLLKRRSDGNYEYESERVLSPVFTNMIDLAGGRATCTFTPASAGQYVLIVSETNSGASASWSFYAGRPGDEWQSWSLEQPGTVSLSFDKPVYHAGDTALLRITAPFTGRALLALESWRVLDTRVLDLTQNTCVVSIPVRADFAPNVYASVSVIRPVRAETTPMPHRAVGAAPLVVARPQHAAALTLQLATSGVPLSASAPVVLPRARLTCQLAITNAPDDAFDCTIAAVDEGICMLTDFPSPDPLKFFNARRALGVSLYDLYHYLMPEFDAAVLGVRSAPGGDGAYAGALRQRLNPMDARRFTPVALWSGRLATDSNGIATACFKLPEFAGTLRLMAVAASAHRLGAVQHALRVKAPLVVRSSAPRFLAPLDQSTLAVQCYNESQTTLTARLALRVSPPLLGSTNLTFTLPAGASAATVLPLAAAHAPGVATVNLSVTSELSTFNDSFELAVRPPAPLAVRAASGVIPAGVVSNVALPADWLPGTAQHTLWCSGYPAVTWSHALDFVMNYPHGCLEQTVSAAMPLLHLASLAAATRPGSIGAEEVQRRVNAGIVRTLSMQLADGSFAYWPRNTETYEWGSIYATHFLLAAQRAGYDVSQDQLNAALDFLAGRLATRSVTPGTDDDAWRDDMSFRAYACWVLALAERPVSTWLARLHEQHAMLPPPARAYLAAALAAANQRRDAATLLRAIGVPAPASIPREASGCLHSGIGTWAVLLAAWLDVDPQDAAVPLLARQLEAAMHDGCWFTTFDSARALCALGLYAERCLLSREPLRASVAWNSSAAHTDINESKDWFFSPVFSNDTVVTLANHGPAPLFFSWYSRGIPSDGHVPETDAQLRARRVLRDAHGTPLTNTCLTRGEVCVIELVLDTLGAPRHNLVVEDLLPAGLELENPHLRTSRTPRWLANASSFTPQHIEQRDDRLVLFISSLEGSNSFFYSARAVTPGTYVWPPVSAECMYDSSVRSIHGCATLEVSE